VKQWLPFPRSNMSCPFACLRLQYAFRSAIFFNGAYAINRDDFRGNYLCGYYPCTVALLHFLSFLFLIRPATLALASVRIHFRLPHFDRAFCRYADKKYLFPFISVKEGHNRLVCSGKFQGEFNFMRQLIENQ